MEQKIKINDTLSVSFEEGNGTACTPISNALIEYRHNNYYAHAQMFSINLMTDLQDYLERVNENELLTEILEQTLDYVDYLINNQKKQDKRLLTEKRAEEIIVKVCKVLNRNDDITMQADYFDLENVSEIDFIIELLKTMKESDAENKY